VLNVGVTDKVETHLGSDDSGIIIGTVQTSVSRDREVSRENPLRTDAVTANIPLKHLSNTLPQNYSYTNLFGCLSRKYIPPCLAYVSDLGFYSLQITGITAKLISVETGSPTMQS
jgi:hypothetical protein